MVKSSSEQLYPFFQGNFSGFSDTHFVSTQSVLWKRRNITVLNLMRVSRLWRGLAEPLLYSAFYVEQEWRLQRFIDSIKENPILAEQLRTLVIMPSSSMKGLREPLSDVLVLQVLGLCHGVTAVVVDPDVLSSPMSLFQSLDSSRRLRLLSAHRLRNGGFPTLMINFSDYATLQVLELSVKDIKGHTLPFPKHITFPSLHTLVLGYLDPHALLVVGKWELPSLKKLSINRWNPTISTALIPLIQRSYDRLEFLNACMDLLHDRALYRILQAPPIHLRKLTLGIDTSGHSSPPMQLAVKPVLCHIITFGISKVGMIRPENKPAWVRFFSDPTYMPHLCSVLTDATTSLLELCLRDNLPLLDVLRSFEEVLEARGVEFKGVTNDNSSFVPIKLLQEDSFEVSISLFSPSPWLISFLYQDHNPQGKFEDV